MGILILEFSKVYSIIYIYIYIYIYMFEGRILRAVALVAATSGGGWMKNLKKCMGCFGWSEIGVEEVKGLSYGEITTMLQACARRKVEDEWDDKLATKPKLAWLRLLKEKGGES